MDERFYSRYNRGDIDFKMSSHAIERALEMGIDGAELRHAMEFPEKSHYSVKHGKWCLTYGRISIGVAVADRQASVVTVLWSTREGWEADYERGTAPGRERRTRILTSK